MVSRSAAVGGVLMLVIAGALIGGCGIYEMKSAWRDREVVIDGVDDGIEWKRARYNFEDDKAIVGLLNDNDTLYLRISVRDEMVQRGVLLGGLTVWFNETGDKEKTVGVRFPLGKSERMGSRGSSQGQPPSSDDDQDAPGMEPPDERVPPDGDAGELPGPVREDVAGPRGTNRRIAIPDALHDTIELIWPDGVATVRLSSEEAMEQGVEYRIGNTRGNMVYELSVPLYGVEDGMWSVCRGRPGIIGIGLETGEIDMTGRRGRGEVGGRDGTGGGGMFGGMGGGRRGVPGNGMPLRVDMWMKVTLAAEPSPS